MPPGEVGVADGDPVLNSGSIDCNTQLLNVEYTIENNGISGIPAGASVAFYSSDPTLAGAQLMATSLLETSVAPDSSGTFTSTIPVGAASAGDLFIVFNDNGANSLPLVLDDLGDTGITECDFQNNIDSMSITISNCTDFDNDGVFDVFDLDDDNDGILDAVESPNCFYTEAEALALVSLTTDAGYLASEQDEFDALASGSTSAGFNFINSEEVNGGSFFTMQLPVLVELSSIDFNMLNGLSFLNSGNNASNTSSNTQIILQGSIDGSNWTDLSNSTYYDRLTTTGTIESFPVTKNSGKYFYYRIIGDANVPTSNTYLNGTIESIQFNTAEDFVPSLYPKTTCTDNADGMGGNNHQNLDSDGDDCSDSYEAGAITTETANNQFITVAGEATDSNGDGLPDVVETGVVDGIPDYTLLRYAYDSTLNACLDTDNDGVGDLIDIDDDNDGILDVVELSCGTGSAATTTANTVTTAGSQYFEGVFSNGSSMVDYSVDFEGLSAALVAANIYDGNGGVHYVVDDSNKDYSSTITVTPQTNSLINTLTWGPNLVGNTDTENDNDEQTIILNWTPAIMGTVYDPDNQLDINGVVDATDTGGVVITSGDFIFQRAEFENASPPTWYVEYDGSFLNSSFALTTNHSSVAGALTDEGYSIVADICYLENADGMGAANYLNLDSDGDGCSDAYESGATTDSTVSQFTSMAGTTTDMNSDGLPDVVETGVVDGTPDYAMLPYGYSNALNLCLDFDNDGIGDVVDIDDDSDGVLDVVESPNCFYSKDELEANAFANIMSDIPFTSARPLENAIDGSLTTYADMDGGNVVSDGKTLIEVTMPEPHAGAGNFYAVKSLDLRTQRLNFGSTQKLQGWDGTAWVDLSLPFSKETTNLESYSVANTLAPDTKVSKLRLLGIGDFINTFNIYDLQFKIDHSKTAFLKNVTCTDNIDGDANLNHLDVDSDGCSDAVELGVVDYTSNDIVTIPTGVDTDGDGLLDIYEANGTATYQQGYYDNFISDPNVNACADSDGDMIPDITDIDDDNDGILDIIEDTDCANPPATAVPSGQVNYTYQEIPYAQNHDVSPINATGFFDEVDAYGLPVSSLPIESSGTLPTFDKPPFDSANGDLVIQEFIIVFPAEFHGMAINIRFADSGGAVESGFWVASNSTDKFDWVDPINQNPTSAFFGEPMLDMGDTLGTGMFPLGTDSDSDTRGAYDDFEATVTASPGGNYIRNYSIDPQVGYNVGNFEYYNPNTDTWVLWDSNMYYTDSPCGSGRDTDNDGIPNRIDLDSDGDGCSDFSEAYSTTGNFISGTTEIVTTGTNWGANGFEETLETDTDNGIPTATAPSGLEAPSVANSTAGYANALDENTSTCGIDSDGDSVPDDVDLDDDNDGILDIVENCGGFISQNVNGPWEGSTDSSLTVDLPGASINDPSIYNFSDGQGNYYINSQGGDPSIFYSGNNTFTATFNPGVPANEIAFYVRDLDFARSPNGYFEVSANGAPAGSLFRFGSEITYSSTKPPFGYDAVTSQIVQLTDSADQNGMFLGVGDTLITEITIEGFNLGSGDTIIYSLLSKVLCDTDGDGIIPIKH